MAKKWVLIFLPSLPLFIKLSLHTKTSGNRATGACENIQTLSFVAQVRKLPSMLQDSAKICHLSRGRLAVMSPVLHTPAVTPNRGTGVGPGLTNKTTDDRVDEAGAATAPICLCDRWHSDRHFSARLFFTGFKLKVGLM